MATIKQKVDLVVFSSDNTRDVAMWMATLRFGAPVGCFSLAEMATKIQILCGGGKREIARLTIIGHGDQFHQSVGVNELSPDCHGNLGEDETKIFKSISSFFAKNGTIVLGGCQVGKTAAIVNALSLILPGIKVRAFTAQQRPALIGYLQSQGGMVESVNGRVVQRTSENAWDGFDGILFRVFEAMPTIPSF